MVSQCTRGRATDGERTMAEVNMEEMSILREHDIAIVSVADAEHIGSDAIAGAGPEANRLLSRSGME